MTDSPDKSLPLDAAAEELAEAARECLHWGWSKASADRLFAAVAAYEADEQGRLKRDRVFRELKSDKVSDKGWTAHLERERVETIRELDKLRDAAEDHAHNDMYPPETCSICECLRDSKERSGADPGVEYGSGGSVDPAPDAAATTSALSDEGCPSLFWKDVSDEILRLQSELDEAEQQAGQWERAAQERYELLIDQTRQAHEARTALGNIRSLVDSQAEDEGLWFVAETAAEAYLQQELRRLHGAIEADSAREGPTEPARHAYEGNWPYEPCQVCGRKWPNDADVHLYAAGPTEPDDDEGPDCLGPEGDCRARDIRA